MSFLRWFRGEKSERRESAATLVRLASRVFDEPLMIEPRKRDAILSVLSDRVGVAELRLAPEALDEQAALPSEGVARLEGQPSVAVIPVHGTLVQRTGGLDAFSGLTSYGAIRKAFDAALADESVKEIVLDIDSPGGEVAGVFDLVDHIAASREAKPVTAVVNELAASAAYALASAASRIVAPRTARIGSIGVILTHVDQSAWNEKAGIRVTHITAGAHKADGNPHEALPDDVRAELQGRIDSVYDLFVNTVATNRGIDAQKVRDTEARVYLAADARALGLIDEIAPAEQALADAVARMAAPALPDIPGVPDDEDESAKAPVASVSVLDPATAPEATSPPVDVEAKVAEAVKAAQQAERARAAETFAIVKTFGAPPELAAQLVARGADLEQVRRVASSAAAAADPDTFNAVDPLAGAPDDTKAILVAAARRRNERNKR